MDPGRTPAVLHVTHRTRERLHVDMDWIGDLRVLGHVAARAVSSPRFGGGDRSGRARFARETERRRKGDADQENARGDQNRSSRNAMLRPAQTGRSFFASPGGPQK
jgi:hypothetical protein